MFSLKFKRGSYFLKSNIEIYPGLKAKLPLINLEFQSNNKLVFHKSVHFRVHSCDFCFEGLRLSDLREKIIIC